jgi:hypothetical protein
MNSLILEKHEIIINNIIIKPLNMKSIILAALLGAMTYEDVNAMKLSQSGPASNASE